MALVEDNMGCHAWVPSYHVGGIRTMVVEAPAKLGQDLQGEDGVEISATSHLSSKPNVRCKGDVQILKAAGEFDGSKLASLTMSQYCVYLSLASYKATYHL